MRPKARRSERLGSKKQLFGRPGQDAWRKNCVMVRA
jgi:hypothetical protein